MTAVFDDYYDSSMDSFQTIDLHKHNLNHFTVYPLLYAATYYLVGTRSLLRMIVNRNLYHKCNYLIIRKRKITQSMLII